MKTFEELIGLRLVFSLAGTKPTEQELLHFRQTRAGGLILYRRNFESPKQLQELIRGLEEALERRLLVCADHEGGRVVMFGKGTTIFPDSLAVGEAGEAGWARLQGEMEAKELRRLGVDVNLAPVLDVLTDSYSPNIGIRSYGKDPQKAALFGCERISSMQRHGLSACAKHFPGKGHSPVDAHLGLPVIASTREEMEKIHLVPFVRAVEAGVDAVMTSHPRYPSLDPGPKTIATFSRTIVQGMLREELGFQGVIVSDDLEMGAVKEICPAGEAALHAVLAGHDLLLVCQSLEAQAKAFAALKDAVSLKKLKTSDLEKSAERIEKLKAKRAQRFAPGNPEPESGGRNLAAQISKKAARVLKDPKGMLPLTREWLRHHTVCAVIPRFSELASRITIEEEILDEASFLKKIFKPYGAVPVVQIVSMEPKEAEIEAAVLASGQTDLTVYFCFDAHLYPSCRRLLEKIQDHAPRCAVVLLRDPYDLEFVRDSAAAVTAYGFRTSQLSACVEKIFE